MSLSIKVVGYRPADDQWMKMKAVYDACEAAGVATPADVDDFFGCEDPGDAPGKEVDLGDGLREWEDKYSTGYEIDIEALPKGVRFLRVYMS